MLKLVNKEQPKGIWAGDMKDGDIGVIVEWTDGMYIGRIVQRYKDYLISVGALSGNGWGQVFNNSGSSLTTDCRIRLLEKGETLIVD